MAISPSSPAPEEAPPPRPDGAGHRGRARRPAVLLLLLVAVAAWARVSDLHADPPDALDGVFITDEGWWAHNARNRVLFGTWTTDDFNQALYAAPLHTGTLWLAFETLGPGLAEARLVSALAGIGTLLALLVMLHATLGRDAALLGGVVFAADYFSFTYHRVALVEANATFVSTLAVALAVLPVRRRLALFAAGAVGVLAVFTKTNSVFVLPALALAALLGPSAGRRTGAADGGPGPPRPAALLWLGAGATACGLTWLVGFVLPDLQEFVTQNRRLAVEGRVRDLPLLTTGFAIGLVGEPDADGIALGPLLRQAVLPVALGLAWSVLLSVRIALRGWREALSRITWIEWVALCWVASQMAYLATHHNTIGRRYCMLVVPLCMLAGATAARPWREVFREPARPHAGGSRWIAAALLVVAAAVYLRVPVMHAVAPLLESAPLGTEPGLTRGALAAVAVALLLAVGTPLAALLLGGLARLRLPTIALPVAAAALCVPALVSLYAADFGARTHTIREASRELEHRFGPDARVFGGVANTLLLGAPNPTLFLLDRQWTGDRVFGQAYLDAFDPTHVLIYGATDAADLADAVTANLGDAEVVPETVEILPLCPTLSGAPRFVVGAAALSPRTRVGTHRDPVPGDPGAAAIP